MYSSGKVGELLPYSGQFLWLRVENGETVAFRHKGTRPRVVGVLPTVFRLVALLYIVEFWWFT